MLNGSTPESDEEGDSTRTLGPGTPLTQGDVSRRLFAPTYTNHPRIVLDRRAVPTYIAVPVHAVW